MAPINIPPPHKHSFLHSLLRFLLFFALLTIFLLSTSPCNLLIESSRLMAQSPGLTFVTLSFNTTYDHPTIEHNCAVISASHHQFIIYTDDLLQDYCKVCQCRLLRLIRCRCPVPQHRECMLCEKLHFISRMVTQLGEFALLDADLTILDPTFMDRLYRRSRDFDFLASYGFGDICDRVYYSTFNSGLFFMRRMAGVNYSELVSVAWELRSNNDQNALSKFVYRRYEYWDSLSLRWHCRFLHKRGFEIEPRECFTIHGRGKAVKDVLEKVNVSLSKVEV